MHVSFVGVWLSSCANRETLVFGFVLSLVFGFVLFCVSGRRGGQRGPFDVVVSAARVQYEFFFNP